MATRVYHSDSGGSDTTTQSATVYTDHRTLTFTPDAAGGTYLLLGYCESTVDINNARDTQVRLYHDTAAVSLMDLIWEPNATTGDEWQPFTFMEVLTFAASQPSQTYKIQHKLETTLTNADSVCRNGSLVALKLDAADVTASANTGNTSVVNAGSWTDASTVLTFTPATTGDYLILAWAKGEHSALTSGSRLRMLCEDGTTGVGQVDVTEHDSACNRSTTFTVKRTGLTNSSKTFKIQHSRSATAGTSTISALRYVALRLDGFDANTDTQDTTADTTTSASYADAGSTRTDTLASGVDYLLIVDFVASHGTVDTLVKVKVTNGTTTYAEAVIEPELAAHGGSGTVAKIITGTGASVTHAVQLASESGTATLHEHRLYVLQVESSGGSSSPAAAVASGTGAAYNASVSVAPNAAVASATGTAQAPSASVKPSAAVTSGTGAAQNATASVAPVVGVGSGTGSAYNATVSVAGSATNASAAVASGTGSAQTPSVSVAPTGGNASGTGAANGATTSVSPTVGVSSGTGTANNATVSAAGVTNAAATVASGTGTASSATTSVAPVVGVASGTGTANNATVSTSAATSTSVYPYSTLYNEAGEPFLNEAGDEIIAVGGPQGFGRAHNATVTTGAGGGATNAPATVASGTGSAHNPSVSVAVRLILPAEGSGTAEAREGDAALAMRVAPTAGNASGTGTANNATVSTAGVTNAAAAVASGTGAAHNASVSLSVSAVLASAVAVAYDPGGSIAPLVGVGSITGSAHDAAIVVSGVDLNPILETIRIDGTTATLETDECTATVHARESTATLEAERVLVTVSAGQTATVR